jgi:hypothetical protein
MKVEKSQEYADIAQTPSTKSCFHELHLFINTSLLADYRIEPEYGDGIHESTISLRFLGPILRFLRLEVSTFIFAILENAIHDQT